MSEKFPRGGGANPFSAIRLIGLLIFLDERSCLCCGKCSTVGASFQIVCSISEGLCKI